MDALVMALLAMASVSLWTLRVALMGRGGRPLASAVAAVEALVYVTTFGRLLQDLTATGRLLGFATGVATGTYLGMLVDERLARKREERSATAETARRRRGARRWSRSPSRA